MVDRKRSNSYRARLARTLSVRSLAHVETVGTRCVKNPRRTWESNGSSTHRSIDFHRLVQSDLGVSHPADIPWSVPSPSHLSGASLPRAPGPGDI